MKQTQQVITSSYSAVPAGPIPVVLIQSLKHDQV